ncbi:DUF6671 family protein [Nocardia cyriacigeorgica]|uniref:DUF6671 family protein n=1 Tax=Nocardia cyriacigeorgica TaxID=135487 RepID=UPI002454EE45|nr:DUF6671 family protein [Nocardia cyriacigeorgica]
MSAPHPYRDRDVALATKHGKEQVLAAALAERPGLTVQVATGVDTDELGTFTGEIERPAPPRETALRKARLAMQALGLPRGLASEGAFGPHPNAGFIPAGLEILAFVDDDLGLELTVHHLDCDTNFDHTVVDHLDEQAAQFLRTAQFGSHAVIVRPNSAPRGDAPLYKGIRTNTELADAVAHSARGSSDGRARIETDMRAHLNPTRMRSIARLATELAERLDRLCARCDAPGFGHIATEPGLPCKFCFTATPQPAADIHGCARCEHRTRIERHELADPAGCPSCNP